MNVGNMNMVEYTINEKTVEIYEQQKLNCQTAPSREGKVPMQLRSRDQIVSDFERLVENRKEGDKVGPLVRTLSGYVPTPYLPCTTPLQDLSKVMFKDLRLETHHRGSFVLLRSVTPVFILNGVMAIVEDENGDVFQLQLYSRDQPTAETLPHGTILILKEPYLIQCSDGSNGLRVDHISDAIRLSAYDDRVPSHWQGELPANCTAGYLKDLGNSLFRGYEYESAVDCYTKALECSPTAEDINALQRNLCLTFLKLRMFDAALSTIEGSAPTQTALLRKSQALYNLHRYEECVQVLQTLRTEYPENKSADVELKKANQRLEEQNDGKYSFKQLYTELAQQPSPFLDHATYVGPVAVRSAGSKGRGLFTTKAVKAGDLLLCEKAFSFYDKYEASVMVDPITKAKIVDIQADLMKKMGEKILCNPSLASVIADLDHGSYPAADVNTVDGRAVVDSFLLSRIISLNAFGSPPSSRLIYTLTKQKRYDQLESLSTIYSTGVWATASYVNHSCHTNARGSYIGDIMIVRACQDLEPNTEISMGYKRADLSDKDWLTRFQKTWGFKCECCLCQDLAATCPNVMERRRSRGIYLRRLMDSQTPDAKKIESAISTFEETYDRPAVEVPRLQVWRYHLFLAKLYKRKSKHLKAIVATLNVFKSLGFVIEGGIPGSSSSLVVRKWGYMENSLVDCWMLLADEYRSVALHFEAEAVKYAQLSYKISVGEDESFSEIYPSV